MRIEHRCLVRLTCAGCNKSEALVLVLEWSTSQCLGTHFPGSWYAVVAGAVSNVGWRPALFFFVCNKENGVSITVLKKQGFFPKCVHGVGCHVHTPLQGFALDDGRRHHAGVMGAGLLVGRGGVLT